MRPLSSLLMASAMLGGSLAASAQAPPNIALPTVPTTKILAIGRVVPSPAAANSQSIMPKEVSETVKLYLAGKIDSWYVRKDERGVVFLMNVGTVEEAHELLEKLPLGVAGIMKFDFIPMGPLSPLNFLLAPGAALPAASAKP